MLEAVDDPKVVAEARSRLAVTLDTAIDVADAWLASLPGVALLEESARSPDEDQAKRLERSFARFGEHELLAVATEDLAGTDDVYRLGPTEADLLEFAYARSGMNYALLPTAGVRWLVLCTVHDYLLVAGPRPFVEDYAEDPAAIVRDFRAFIDGDPQWEHPAHQKLLRHVAWVDQA
jgi:hypothetical protein